MMQREIVSPASPPLAKPIRRLVEAMLDDAPPDPAIFAALSEPTAIEARAKAAAELQATDWPYLGRYEAANAVTLASGVRPDIVFIGDSITEAWPLADPELFGPGRVCRGIGGQTSPQMLVRFLADVIALAPRAVHLLCGTNDIAGNTGPTTPVRYQANVCAMTDLAAAHNLQVIVGAIPPADRMGWRPGFDPRPWITELNRWLAEFAALRGLPFADYHAALRDERDGMRRDFSHDGVHPNRRGYAAMREALDPLLPIPRL